MVSRNPAALVRAVAFVACAFLTQFASGSALSANSNLSNFQASGPVALGTGQSASVCVTNVDDSPTKILIGLLQADTGSLLAVQEASLPPGQGACLNFAMPTQGDIQPPATGNVVGIVVPGGRLMDQGTIVQDAPGGGCITASVQIQTFSPNGPGQTLIYIPMQEHRERRRLESAD